jgi:hypothetical protein
MAGMQEHSEVSALIPWYVNGTIGEPDRRRMEAHLQACVDCRDELAQELRIYRGMTAETGVEYMPAASLKRLQARLDSAGAAAPAQIAGHAPPARAPLRRSMPWLGVMAASIAVMAVAFSLLAADRWLQFRALTGQPDYHTVTTDSPRPPGEVIRAVFAPNITLVEMQSILDEAQLRIVSGPTEAGVYSLAAKSKRPVSSSLALLRAHAKVRFAESTRPSARPGDDP